jgi:hypothetical protein
MLWFGSIIIPSYKNILQFEKAVIYVSPSQNKPVSSYGVFNDGTYLSTVSEAIAIPEVLFKQKIVKKNNLRQGGSNGEEQ